MQRSHEEHMVEKMIEESPMSETLILFVVNAVLSMLCSQLHKCLYFLLNLTYWAMHFGHYFLTFLVLYTIYWLGYTPKEPRLTLSQLWPLVLTETILSVATCVVHTGGSDGAVHSVRVTDFAVTLVVIFAARFFIEEAYYSAVKSKYTLLLVVIAISSSVAWMEPIMFFNLKTVVAWPLIVLSTSLHFMLTFQITQKTKVHPLTLTRQICGLTSIVVCPLALIFTSDSFNSETQDVTSAWELIDYLIIAMSCFVVSGMIGTKYMLLCKLSPESYAVVRHSKYLVGAYGQWLLQNMAHVTLLSVLGKASATGAISAYCWRRWNERKAAMINMHHQSKNLVTISNGSSSSALANNV